MYSEYAGDFQSAVWYLTDGDESTLTPKGQEMLEIATSADKLRVIPDHGYVRTYSAFNSHPLGSKKYTITVTFDFYVLSPVTIDEHGERQDFFMVKVTPLATAEGENPVFPDDTPTDTPDVSPTPKPASPNPNHPISTPTPTPNPPPKTGDTANVSLWGFLMIFSCAALFVLARRRVHD